jgi:hypothetical protein
MLAAEKGNRTSRLRDAVCENRTGADRPVPFFGCEGQDRQLFDVSGAVGDNELVMCKKALGRIISKTTWGRCSTTLSFSNSAE